MSIFPGESEPLPDDDEEKRERNEDDLKCVVGDAAGVDSTKIKLILLYSNSLFRDVDIIPTCLRLEMVLRRVKSIEKWCFVTTRRVSLPEGFALFSAGGSLSSVISA